jgi:hypothetical protein
MQQQKLAAIDDASDRLSRHAFGGVSVTLGAPNVTTIDTGSNTVSPSKSFASPSKSVTVIAPKAASPVQEPKTVDELLDSLHSTPI